MLETLKEQDRRKRRNLIATYFDTPEVRLAYAKQMEFFRLGATFNERALLGGNRSGKSLAGGFEMTLHLTGAYPDWWEGRRFADPVSAWTAGDTAKSVRDIMQSLLIGKPGDPSAVGTGMIPADSIIRTTPKHGLADAMESVFVKHVSGGVSVVQLKSYDQGREAYQGTSQQVVHLDEESPIEIYTESLLRTMTVDGLVFLTATPLLGLTPIMLSFLPELQPTPEENLDG
jgi:phage terminase large subunit-like protein